MPRDFFSLCAKERYEHHLLDERATVRHWKLISRSAAVVGTLLKAALVLLSATSSSAVEPLNALVPTTVEVPLALRDSPFDHDRERFHLNRRLAESAGDGAPYNRR